MREGERWGEAAGCAGNMQPAEFQCMREREGNSGRCQGAGCLATPWVETGRKITKRGDHAAHSHVV